MHRRRFLGAAGAAAGLTVPIATPRDERELLGTLGELPFSGALGEREDGSRVVLLDAEWFAPGDLNSGAARADYYPAFRPHLFGRDGRIVHAVDPDERPRRRYLVLAHPEDRPLSPGTYTFTAGYADRTQEFTCGFALSLLE